MIFMKTFWRREAARLVAKYGELYSQARSDLVDFLPRKHLTYEIRLDTLDALDELKELSSAEELKNKLLFSVVVVSFVSNIQNSNFVKQFEFPAFFPICASIYRPCSPTSGCRASGSNADAEQNNQTGHADSVPND